MENVELCRGCNNIREEGSFCPYCGHNHDTPGIQSIEVPQQAVQEIRNPIPPPIVYQQVPTKKKGGIVILIVLLVVVLLSAVGAVMTYVLMPTVPDLVGEQEEDALDILKDSGYGKRDYELEYEYDDQIEKGEIIEQFPEGGKKTFKKNVELVISLGLEEFELEDVIGKSKEDAIAELEDQNLVVKIVEEYSEEPIGNVIGQNPSQGETVQVEDEITLTISKGPDESIIHIADEAFREAVLELLGLKPEDSIKIDMVKNIKELYLNDLDIESLDGIEAFVSLEYLDASDNWIKEINELPISLVYLDVSLNEITELDLKDNIQLEAVHAYINDLTKLPKFPSGIIEIDVSYNDIVDISELKNYKQLKAVDVSENLIDDFSALEEIYESLDYVLADGNPGVFIFGEDLDELTRDYDWPTTVNTIEINNSIEEMYPDSHAKYTSLLGLSVEELSEIYAIELTEDGSIQGYFHELNELSYIIFYIQKSSNTCVYIMVLNYNDTPYFEDDTIISYDINNTKEDLFSLLGPSTEVNIGDEVYEGYFTNDALYAFLYSDNTILWMLIYSNEYLQ